MIEPFSAIAFDPGGTTGVAMLHASLANNELYLEEWSFWQLGPQKHHIELEELLQSAAPNVKIIYERFDYRNRARPGLSMMSRDYIGVIDLWCARKGITPIDQMPAHAKGFVKDSNIKKLGLWEPGQQHAMDALRHLLFWLIHKSGIDATAYLEKAWK